MPHSQESARLLLSTRQPDTTIEQQVIDQQILAMLRTLSPVEREIIALLISKWASVNAPAALSLVRPRPA